MRLPSSWKSGKGGSATTLAILITLVAGGSLPAAEVDDPILGTWNLNLSKSKYIPGSAPRSQTRIYRETAEGIFVTIETIDADGHRLPSIEFSEKYDGKDYPMKGSAVADALALKRINNYLAEATMKHAGSVVATTRRIITDNGKTLMLIYQETDIEHPVDNIIVYDRQLPAEALESRFIGTWKLVAILDRDRASGVETPAARGPAGGQLIYTANGRLSLQIARTGREKLPANSADGFASYFGRWELSPAEGCVIHYQEGNLNAAEAGQSAKRYYSFDAEGRLALATPPARDAAGREMSTVFVWERLP